MVLKKNIIILTLLCFMGALCPARGMAVEFGKVDIHGFISVGFLDSNHNNYLADTEDGTSEFNEKGINFVTPVSERMRIGLQFISRDLGDLGNNETDIDWAYADYRWMNQIGLRAGKIKIPVGLYNETRDMDMLRTSVFLPQSVYSETWRDTVSSLEGIGLYGEQPAWFMGTFSYNLQAGRVKLEEGGGISKFIESTGWTAPATFEAGDTYVASIFWSTPLEGLRVGWSRLKTEFDMYSEIEGMDLNVWLKAPDVKLTTVSAEYTWGNLVLASEYQLYDADITPDLPYLADQVSALLMDDITVAELLELIEAAGYTTDDISVGTEMWGYYYSATYRFTDWFELGAYYSVLYRDRNDKSGTKYANSPILLYPDGSHQPDYNAWQKDTCVSTRFDINENWIIKLEGHFMDGAFGTLPSDNPPTASNPEGTTRDWFLFAAKMTFTF